MRRSLKYRLYTSGRDKHLVRQIHAASSIWNHSLAIRRRYYRLYGKSLSANRLKGHIAKLRKRNPYWSTLGSQATQDVVQRLDKAYDRFFANKGGFPSFKSYRYYTSFTLKQAGWKLLGDNRIRLGNRNYKFAMSRPVTGTIKTVTIKRDRAQDLWTCFSVIEEGEYPVTNEDAVTTPVGINMGLKTFATLSNKKEIHSPQYLKQSLAELRSRSKQLSGKRPGSRNRSDAKRRVAKLHRRVADQRRDWAFKKAHELCDKYDGIAIEDPELRGMVALWGRKVSDISWGEFVRILEYVCRKRGVVLKKVDPAYTSKTCSDCGEIVQLELSDRSWVCPGCEVTHDRDVNAAINIRGRAFPCWRGNVSGPFELAREGVAVAA
ncbi:transposase [Rhodothermus sp. AH-315-K08]|nr:transposase [Rhodothermus sp. AH-315-K08]